ncbi:hypothetical protein BVRB_4g085480 isoform B [Beta vulgaris subsp. vulgaris]|nr:hypothetical protein BVRB_4g085480 isoform B [Beta vulgaris subsp. vulgaris]
MDPSASLQGHTDNGEAVPLANYHPDIWSDVFSDYTPLDQATQNKKEEEVIVLIEEVRKELLTIVKDPKERLLLVDAIQRLGVAYYFEEEIEANLKEFYKTLIGDSYKHDLHFTSLRFRLLRQHGFYESCDVFVKYKDENGSFKDCLTSNVHGILSLYEASHLRLRGESVLDDAFAFSMTHLSSLAPTLRSPMAEQIANALKRPLYKCTTRLEAKYQQISLSESNGSHFQALLKLAKSDFNLLQLLHKKELSDIIRDKQGRESRARRGATQSSGSSNNKTATTPPGGGRRTGGREKNTAATTQQQNHQQQRDNRTTEERRKLRPDSVAARATTATATTSTANHQKATSERDNEHHTQLRWEEDGRTTAHTRGAPTSFSNDGDAEEKHEAREQHLGWSRRLDFKGKFSFARDRVVEPYIWSLGIYYEPKYSFARMIVNKVFKLITVVDDMYDAYGTIDELEAFTEAILRWDESCMNELPDYMKLLYQIILDTFQEFQQDLANEGRSYAVFYLQNELLVSCQAYLQEARWCHEKYVPTYDEYMKNATISSVYCFMLMATYQGMGEIASKDAIEWILKNSKAIKASCIHGRLLDDMAGHKFEQKREHVSSAVECYMANFSVSEEEAYEKLLQQVEEAWKDLKAEMFRSTAVPMPLLMQILNMSRALYDVYHIGADGFTVSECMKEKIEALLIDTAI